MPPARTRTTRWAGIAPDDRRAERRELLLRAALELLGTEGWSGTTVRAVCSGARLNPRYFYESFHDLDDLVIAVYDRLVAELLARVRSAVAAAGSDTSAQVRAAVEATVQFVEEDRRRARILYVEALGNEALNRRRLRTGFAMADAIVRDARRGRPGTAPDPIVRSAALVLVGGFSELLVGWIDGEVDRTCDELVDDATELFVALGDAAASVAARRRRPRR